MRAEHIDETRLILKTCIDKNRVHIDIQDLLDFIVVDGRTYGENGLPRITEVLESLLGNQDMEVTRDDG